VALGLSAAALAVAAAALPPAFADGALTQPGGERGCISEAAREGCTAGRALDAVAGIAVSPDGRNVYAMSMDSRAVAVLRHRRGGSLGQSPGTEGCVSELGGIGCAAGRNLDIARTGVVSRDGRHLYVSTQGGLAAFGRNRRTGALTQLPGENGCVRADAAMGCAAGRAVHGGRDVALSADGRTLYAVGLASSVAVFRRDRASGALTQLSGTRGCVKQAGLEPEGCASGRGLQNTRALLVAPGGRRLYVGALGDVTTSAGAAIAVFRPGRSGALTQLGGARGCLNADGAEGCRPTRGMLGVHDLVLSMDGRTLYAPASTAAHNGAMPILRRLPGGRLRQPSGRRGCFTHDGSQGCAPARGLEGAHTLTFSRDGRTAYVASEVAAGSLAVFTRAGRRGGLRQPSGAAGCLNADGSDGCAVARGLRGAHQTALSPDGRRLYVGSLFDDAVVVLHHRSRRPRVAGRQPPDRRR
jgi:DNA-binding beta-propeller fold protein YncE